MMCAKHIFRKTRFLIRVSSVAETQMGFGHGWNTDQAEGDNVSMQNANSKLGLLICSDLFFTSKVTGTAQALGLRMEAVDDVASVVARLPNGEFSYVVLDLASRNAAVPELLAAMPSSGAVPVIAFGSHVNVEQLESARAAGVEVMPRSQFHECLETELAGWANT